MLWLCHKTFTDHKTWRKNRQIIKLASRSDVKKVTYGFRDFSSFTTNKIQIFMFWWGFNLSKTKGSRKFLFQSNRTFFFFFCWPKHCQQSKNLIRKSAILNFSVSYKRKYYYSKFCKKKCIYLKMYIPKTSIFTQIKMR